MFENDAKKESWVRLGNKYNLEYNVVHKKMC